MGLSNKNRGEETSCKEEPLPLWKRVQIRFALSLFVLGASLESMAIWLSYSGKFAFHVTKTASPLDELLSLAATMFLSASALLFVNGIGHSIILTALAALFIVASKFLDATHNFWSLINMPILGRTDPRNQTLSHLFFVFGFLTLLFAFGKAVFDTYRTRLRLESRHRALLKETEERRRVEDANAQLATVIEQSAESVIITDVEGHILYVNPAFEAISGYTSSEVLGRTPDFLESGEVSPEHFEEFYKTIYAGKVWKGQFINRKKDGALFIQEATITPVRGKDGKIITFAAIQRDITREAELERQLLQAQKMQAIGTLAGGIAHDFRNTLALIMGHCEIAMGVVPENHPVVLHLHKMMRAGNRAADMVKQILTFSRQAEQHRRPVDMPRVVTEALRFLHASFPATIELLSKIDSDAGQVMADPTQIHQVVLNLCTNACQAIGSRKGRIEVSLDRVTLSEDTMMDTGLLTAGTYVRLMVTDNGFGMDETVLLHIFEPFFTTKRKEEGTGLGLSSVHGIVTGTNGGISVRSQVGEGTSFVVYLPHLERPEIYVEPDPRPLSGGNERLLLLDDDEDIVRMVAQMLTGLGYRIETCSDSEKALQLLRERPGDFDLLLTDNIMPKMTGVELARQILDARPHFPIVLLTGYADGITLDEARNMGIAGYVVKPFTEYALNLVLRNAFATNLSWKEDAYTA